MINSQLQQLIDKQALQELAFQYARAIDRRDMALLQSLYHPQAIDEHGTLFCGIAEAYVAAQPELMKDFIITAHYITNSLYVVDEDQANGEVYFQAYHRTHSDPATILWVAGRYLDQYLHTDQGWKIYHRKLVWDGFETREQKASDSDFLLSLGEQGQTDKDASYTHLSLFKQLNKSP